MQARLAPESGEGEERIAREGNRKGPRGGTGRGPYLEGPRPWTAEPAHTPTCSNPPVAGKGRRRNVSSATLIAMRTEFLLCIVAIHDRKQVTGAHAAMSGGGDKGRRVAGCMSCQPPRRRK